MLTPHTRRIEHGNGINPRWFDREYWRELERLAAIDEALAAVKKARQSAKRAAEREEARNDRND